MPPQAEAGFDQRNVVIGSGDNFWTWSRDRGWDLTHPAPGELGPLKTALALRCELSNVTIDTTKSALVIIDLQNYSMCKALAPDVHPSLVMAQETLLNYGIPAARRANIQVIWLNWGLTDQDLEKMPPAAFRTFGFKANSDETDYGISVKTLDETIECGEAPRLTGLGADLGVIELENVTKVEAGRALMKGTWNAALHGPLLAMFEEGQTAPRPDVLIHKNRNSALWENHSDFEIFLKHEGIRTLLFTGANTDQCVMATLQDAHSKSFDTILLKDGCATDSPQYAQQSAEYNCCRNWGFLSSCRALARGAAAI
ncbi:Peroxyureidoacrylate/ureidoacrylate amidohydrolase [Lachnellula suecica]|uniref:Peroxyureidoacrylate/ureidoacrylate amidohydrolase n=1 Tax=Lachnellula suecica TaxID=602035 RepID=A0A8T9CA98_9HELO|nr:Peroxyureidoacrylate/ureidoacrylate amidohydrolase [Lachnellula suecica]